jgi:hypothetical protein
MIVMQWFRKHPREREKCLTPDEALTYLLLRACHH